MNTICKVEKSDMDIKKTANDNKYYILNNKKKFQQNRIYRSIIKV